jgi:hypothetical protein
MSDKDASIGQRACVYICLKLIQWIYFWICQQQEDKSSWAQIGAVIFRRKKIFPVNKKEKGKEEVVSSR